MNASATQVKAHRKKGVRVTIRLPVESAEQFAALCRFYNASQTAVISQAIAKLFHSEPLAWKGNGVTKEPT